MSIIVLNTGYRKFDILHWFACVADGRVDGHVITKFLGWMDYQIFLGVAPVIKEYAKIFLIY